MNKTCLILIFTWLASPPLFSADAWRKLTNGNPPGPRNAHTAVWNGEEMIVWGGINTSFLNTGGRYKPATDSWTACSVSGAPAGRIGHTAVWSGSQMLVWGGFYSSAGNVFYPNGGRYNAAVNTWSALSTTGAPVNRRFHTSVWTGSEMIVWGGEHNTSSSVGSGGRYNPATDTWAAVSAIGAPAGRKDHTAVWTGSEMIIWGGTVAGIPAGNGARYNPTTNTWTAITTAGAPSPRATHTAVWTGSGMIVWGGTGPGASASTGAIYAPATNSWTAVNQTGAPPALRGGHQAVWTGSEMIVWGDLLISGGVTTGGGRYSPSTNSWTAVTTTGAPEARYAASTIWTGNDMILFGGHRSAPPSGYVNETFRYTPVGEELFITRAVPGEGVLILSFPSLVGRTYTLWRSATLAAGSWTNTGLAALAGTGGALSFNAPATALGSQFFHVRSD